METFHLKTESRSSPEVFDRNFSVLCLSASHLYTFRPIQERIVNMKEALSIGCCTEQLEVVSLSRCLLHPQVEEADDEQTLCCCPGLICHPYQVSRTCFGTLALANNR
ncbi:hypothetical protein MHYP_G00227540 [Metynnis hypsauchen]